MWRKSREQYMKNWKYQSIKKQTKKNIVDTENAITEINKFTRFFKDYFEQTEETLNAFQDKIMKII